MLQVTTIAKCLLLETIRLSYKIRWKPEWNSQLIFTITCSTYLFSLHNACEQYKGFFLKILHFWWVDFDFFYWPKPHKCWHIRKRVTLFRSEIIWMFLYSERQNNICMYFFSSNLLQSLNSDNKGLRANFEKYCNFEK